LKTSVRSHFFASLFVGFASAVPAGAASIAGVDVPPPLAAREVVDTHWGKKISDPYRFLENVSDPEVQAWMKGQADATAAILAKIPARDALLARMKQIESQSSGLTAGVRRVAGGRYFFLKRDPADNQFRLVWREKADAPDRLIVDPEELRKKTGKPHAIMDFAPSPDGRRIAYSLQVGGGEIGDLHVVDLETGKPLVDPIDRIRYAGVSWLDDSSGFFYSRIREGYDKFPPSERFADRARHYRALDAAGTDRKIFSPFLNADLKLPSYASGEVFQVPGTRQALSIVFLGVERYVLIYKADLDAAIAGTARWEQVVRVEDQVAEADFGGGYLYLRTFRDAPRFKVLRMPVANPDLAKAEVVMPAGKGVVSNMAGARDALYITRRDGAVQTLWRVRHEAGAKPEQVALPFEGSVEVGASPRVDGATLQLAGWTRYAKPWAYEAGSLKPLPFVAPAAFDAPADIVAREVNYKSHDGVEVPMSILSRKDVKLDGSNPTILYGYGAYGITEDPFFNPRIYAWIEKGGVYAIAHVRGGGAYGKEWHEAGRKATKPNTWKDAIAAAEWLIANKYTSKKRIGIYGGSAGGIFVGRSITERPDLFSAAVPAVGSLDTLRSEISANGAANIPEFGTVAKEDEFRALLEMSTYHHIRDGTSYPAIMLVHGVNDIRVDVWQSLKGGARFAAAKGNSSPVLMRLEYDSGHGQGSTRQQLQARAADIWSFFLWQFGAPEFQPKP
jgi:prolyl oligopeptidase